MIISIFLLLSATFLAEVASGENKNPEVIPGTRIRTNTFYKISTKNAPEGVVTWTSTTTNLDGNHYVQVDNYPPHHPNYFRNGKWLADAQWEFIPVPSFDECQWYRMRNKGRPDEYLTWSETEFVEGPGQTNHIVLDSNQKGLRSSHDFLVKPVRAKGAAGEYYQLKLKGFPKGVVTFSTKVYAGTDQRYIMVDNSRDESRMKRYAIDGDWYKFTLLSFDMPVINENPVEIPGIDDE